MHSQRYGDYAPPPQPNKQQLKTLMFVYTWILQNVKKIFDTVNKS